MKNLIINVSAILSVALMAPNLYARDVGVLVLPVHQGKITSSLVYEHLKIEDDFKTRGRADFKANIVAAIFSYGITDQVSLAVKGGSIIDPRIEAQGSAWESRAGYLYGFDLYNEVFPATPGLRPGVQLSAGVTGFQVPLDRQITANTVTLIDQRQTGIEYHGAVVATFKVGPTEPYFGLRGFGSTVRWKDNSPSVGAPDHITGHAHGNISIVTGLPVQVTKDVRLELEGRFINETAVTAGFTVAVF